MRHRDASSQGRFIPFFQGRIVQELNVRAPDIDLTKVLCRFLRRKYGDFERILKNNVQ
jgi:hypothetical protein